MRNGLAVIPNVAEAVFFFNLVFVYFTLFLCSSYNQTRTYSAYYIVDTYRKWTISQNDIERRFRYETNISTCV